MCGIDSYWCVQSAEWGKNKLCISHATYVVCTMMVLGLSFAVYCCYNYCFSIKCWLQIMCLKVSSGMICDVSDVRMQQKCVQQNVSTKLLDLLLFTVFIPPILLCRSGFLSSLGWWFHTILTIALPFSTMFWARELGQSLRQQRRVTKKLTISTIIVCRAILEVV